MQRPRLPSASALLMALSVFSTSTLAQTSEPAKSEAQEVKRDEAGSPKPGAKKFDQLRIGMNPAEVNQMLGRAPDDYHTYESGKRWIPFYFGGDLVRLQARYKGEGCLIFSVGRSFHTHGKEWDYVDGELMEIAVDPSGACYKP